MFKEMYADCKIQVNAPVEQAFQLITDIKNWKSWTHVNASYVLSPGGWKKGAMMVFFPVVSGLPWPPVLCKIYASETNHLIQWGMKLGPSEIIHQFTFQPNGSQQCTVHQEEWASGLVHLVTKPIGKFIGEFDDQMGKDLVQYFASKGQ